MHDNNNIWRLLLVSKIRGLACMLDLVTESNGNPLTHD